MDLYMFGPGKKRPVNIKLYVNQINLVSISFHWLLWKWYIMNHDVRFPQMNCLIIFYNRHLRKNIEQSLFLKKKKAWCINLLQSFETRLTFSTRSEKQHSSDHWMYYMCVGVYDMHYMCVGVFDMCTGHLY